MVVVLLTTATVLAGTAGAAAEAVRPKLTDVSKRPKAPNVKAVPGKPSRLKDFKIPERVDKKAPSPKWPGKRRARADLAPLAQGKTSPNWVRAGDLPVFLNRPGKQGSAQLKNAVPTAVPAQVDVAVADQSVAQRSGTDGLIVTLAGQAAGKVKVGSATPGSPTPTAATGRPA